MEIDHSLNRIEILLEEINQRLDGITTVACALMAVKCHDSGFSFHEILHPSRSIDEENLNDITHAAFEGLDIE